MSSLAELEDAMRKAVIPGPERLLPGAALAAARRRRAGKDCSNMWLPGYGIVIHAAHMDGTNGKDLIADKIP